MNQGKIYYCNCCGKEFIMKGDIVQEECISISHTFGYFSNGRDGEEHSFKVCENCYEKWIQTFTISPEVTQVTELMSN